MIYILIFIMLFVKESKGEWKLVWNEEFENTTLDTEKWEIENELVACHGNHIKQLNCNTNSARNLRLINGTLAITAIYEKHLDKEYTSGRIITKQGFTYGRFEIRAALPNGKLLRPSVFMIPVTISDWPRNGQIDIMTNDHTSKPASGLHYNIPKEYKGNDKEEFKTNKSLNNFHTYAIEWNQSEFKWFFDDINYLTININMSLGSIYTENVEPFDSPFRLLIHLGVGGQFFSSQILKFEDVMAWKCSLFIIDYVRIYELDNRTEKRDSKDDEVSTDSICSYIMPLIKPKEKGNQYSDFSPSVTVIVITISFIFTSLIIILISIIVFLSIRQKKLESIIVENSYESYNDIFDSERNDALNINSEYEEISVNYVESDEISLKENLYKNPIYLGTSDKT